MINDYISLIQQVNNIKTNNQNILMLQFLNEYLIRKLLRCNSISNFDNDIKNLKNLLNMYQAMF